jgi:hypothetical protein
MASTPEPLMCRDAGAIIALRCRETQKMILPTRKWPWRPFAVSPEMSYPCARFELDIEPLELVGGP